MIVHVLAKGPAEARVYAADHTAWLTGNDGPATPKEAREIAAHHRGRYGALIYAYAVDVQIVTAGARVTEVSECDSCNEASRVHSGPCPECREREREEWTVAELGIESPL